MVFYNNNSGFLISFSSLPLVILAIEVVCTLFSKLPSLFEMKATK